MICILKHLLFLLAWSQQEYDFHSISLIQNSIFKPILLQDDFEVPYYTQETICVTPITGEINTNFSNFSSPKNMFKK